MVPWLVLVVYGVKVMGVHVGSMANIWYRHPILLVPTGWVNQMPWCGLLSCSCIWNVVSFQWTGSVHWYSWLVGSTGRLLFWEPCLASPVAVMSSGFVEVCSNIVSMVIPGLRWPVGATLPWDPFCVQLAGTCYFCYMHLHSWPQLHCMPGRPLPTAVVSQKKFFQSKRRLLLS